jgi:hypothetical protein
VRDESTLGGYLDRHERPPAFEGKDGRSYSVSIILADEEETEGFGAALMFIRWSSAGDAPDGHVETEYLVFATTSGEANLRICELGLHDVKKSLDDAIDRAAARSEW